jgi:hypothetical protein
MAFLRPRISLVSPQLPTYDRYGPPPAGDSAGNKPSLGLMFENKEGLNFFLEPAWT